ncbi:hypothetical protein [Spongiactinospora gelatinilytica]|uniref:hypothetical protein n=1 Tax=Spongiactinospora gelatinilytica TaxID=2666298 RepID=UPI001F3C4820|nr:hypothetical protein [Spongiactinospora gelatinilytica]
MEDTVVEYLGSPPRRRGRPWKLWVAVIAMAVIGVAAGVYGGLEVRRELERPPTQAEKDAAAVKEVALRWRTRRAGQIFPAEIEYGERHRARRVGIAPQARCDEAVDPAVALVFVNNGCSAVLRATYIDHSRTLVTTVGIAVLPSEKAADKAVESIRAADGMLRAAAFPGTRAAWYRDAARQDDTVGGYANYVLLAASGYADGRKRITADRPKLFALDDTLITRVGAALGEERDPCEVAGVVQC